MTVPIDLHERSSAWLRDRRSALVRTFPPLEAILRGSLIARSIRCGKPGCKCATGPGHGPKHYLSVSMPKRRPQMDYVPIAYEEQVRDMLHNYAQTRAILEEICEINRELVRRRETL